MGSTGLLRVAFVCATLGACGRKGVETANVNLTWSIDGKDAEERCVAHKAAWIEIEVHSASGERIDGVVHRCFEAHPIDLPDKAAIPQGAALMLPVGQELTATARLEDSNRKPVTSPVTVKVSPGAAGPLGEPNFEFNGAFAH